MIYAWLMALDSSRLFLLRRSSWFIASAQKWPFPVTLPCGHPEISTQCDASLMIHRGDFHVAFCLGIFPQGKSKALHPCISLHIHATLKTNMMKIEKIWSETTGVLGCLRQILAFSCILLKLDQQNQQKYQVVQRGPRASIKSSGGTTSPERCRSAPRQLHQSERSTPGVLGQSTRFGSIAVTKWFFGNWTKNDSWRLKATLQLRYYSWLIADW